MKYILRQLWLVACLGMDIVGVFTTYTFGIFVLLFSGVSGFNEYISDWWGHLVKLWGIRLRYAGTGDKKILQEARKLYKL